MSPEFHLPKQQGFGLPAAIFVVTILALIIAATSNIQRNSAEGMTLQIQSSRAFYSAESGIQVALNLLLPPDGSAGRSCATSPFFYQRNFTAAGLGNCSASVVCSSVTVNSETYYTLSSTGVCGTGIDRAQRQIEVRAK